MAGSAVRGVTGNDGGKQQSQKAKGRRVQKKHVKRRDMSEQPHKQRAKKREQAKR